MPRRITVLPRVRRTRETRTWWIIERGSERYVVAAIERRIGYLRSVEPTDVFIHYEETDSGRLSGARTIEEMHEFEFAAMIASGAARQLQ